MPDSHANECLSWGDSIFLYFEREGMPQHLAGVSIFEGIIPFEECVRYVESKLPLIPRYTERVVSPPLDIAFPTWEQDPAFDIRNHMRRVTLKTGLKAEFKAVAAEILSTTMDRRRPLWDLTLLYDYNGKRTGLVARVHHCLADGIGGIGLMNIIMDPKPVRHPRHARKLHLARVQPRDNGKLLLDAVVSSCTNVVQRAITAELQMLRLVGGLVGSSDAPVTELLADLPELASAAEPLPFNQICRGPQKIAWVEMPLADIKAIKNASETTVNDVVLTLVTAAIQRYCEFLGANLKGRWLRIMVPVNMRNGDDSSLGNHISLLPVTVPLYIRQPRKLLAAVHDKMEFLKQAHVAELVGLVGTLMGITPAPLQAAVLPIASQLPIHLFNLVCTNVPGPQNPLYLLGHKMLHWYPFVPIGGNMALNCAILSYNGTVYFGFRGDMHAAPQIEKIEKFLKASFEELRKASGIKSLQKRPAIEATRKTIKAPGPSGSRTEVRPLITAKMQVAPASQHQAEKPKARAAAAAA